MDLREKIEGKLFGDVIASIGFSELENGQWHISAIVQRLDSTGDILIQEREEFSSVGQLNSWLEERRKLPLIIAIDSPEILVRLVDTDETEKEKLLKSIIPQSSPEEFFLQASEEDSRVLVALVRNHIVTNVLNLLLEETVVVDVVLAPLAKATLAKATNQESLSIGGMGFAIHESKIVKLMNESSMEVPAEFLNEGLSAYDLIAYGAGLMFFSQIEFLTEYPKKEKRAEQMHRTFLLGFAKYVIAAVFLVFFINAFLFLEFTSTNEELNEENVGLLTLEKRLEDYTSYVAEHNDLLRGDDAQIIRVVDDLAKSVPNGLSLQYLELYPLHLQAKSVGPMNVLRVRGQVENTTEYTNWIEYLNGLHWVLDITKNEYRGNVQSGIGQFELEITLLEDV